MGHAGAFHASLRCIPRRFSRFYRRRGSLRASKASTRPPAVQEAIPAAGLLLQASPKRWLSLAQLTRDEKRRGEPRTSQCVRRSLGCVPVPRSPLTPLRPAHMCAAACQGVCKLASVPCPPPRNGARRRRPPPCAGVLRPDVRRASDVRAAPVSTTVSTPGELPDAGAPAPPARLGARASGRRRRCCRCPAESR